MKYKTVLYDLDGTLLDTLQDLTDSTNAALAGCNLPVRSIDEVRRFVGNGIQKLIARAVPDGTDDNTVQRVFSYFKEYYGAHCMEKTAPYPGILALLRTLKTNGIRQGVISNKADFAVQKLCAFYFDGQIDASVGETEGLPRKPDPALVTSIMKKLCAKKETTLYVGDSEVDIETARNAGIDCLSVTWGFRGSDYLISRGAEHLVDTPEDILSLILRDGKEE